MSVLRIKNYGNILYNWDNNCNKNTLFKSGRNNYRKKQELI